MSNIDPVIKEAIKKYGLDPQKALWNCHGTWVAYHWAIEQIAAKAGVTFDMPQVLEANGETKTAAICVMGHIEPHRSEWSIGEASPANNKNSYPFAMAEKRAKDRVVLKLIGLTGLVYSEEEADDFKASKPAQPETAEHPSDADIYVASALKAIGNMRSVESLTTWWEQEKSHRHDANLNQAHVKVLKEANIKRRDELLAKAA